jgi:hypothetical protein
MRAFGEFVIFRFRFKKGQKGGQNKYRVKPTIGYRFGGGVWLNDVMVNKDINHDAGFGMQDARWESDRSPMSAGDSARWVGARARVQGLKFEADPAGNSECGTRNIEDSRSKMSFQEKEHPPAFTSLLRGWTPSGKESRTRARTTTRTKTAFQMNVQSTNDEGVSAGIELRLCRGFRRLQSFRRAGCPSGRAGSPGHPFGKGNRWFPSDMRPGPAFADSYGATAPPAIEFAGLESPANRQTRKLHC